MQKFNLTDEDIIVANQLSDIMDSAKTKHYMSTQAAENLKRTINQERLPENLPMKNPNKATEELLQKEINQHINTNRQLMKVLTEIEDENTRLNKQVETLNKTIEEQKEKLDEMIEEKKKSDKEYWLKTILISVGGIVLGFILDHLIF